MNKINNFISVVMSTYNNESTIEKSINSLLSQTYQNFEILIMDDASTDDTYKICNNIASKSNKIKIYRNSNNIGLTKSLNLLIKESKAELIARSDADDYSKTNRFELQLDYLIKNNLDACSTRAYEIDSKRIIPGFSYYVPIEILIKYKNPFVHGTLLIKRNVLDSVNLYDELFTYSQDYKLMSDLLKSKFKVSILKTPLYFLNTKNNISSIYKDEQKYFADCVKYNTVPNKNI